MIGLEILSSQTMPKFPNKWSVWTILFRVSPKFWVVMKGMWYEILFFFYEWGIFITSLSGKNNTTINEGQKETAPGQRKNDPVFQSWILHLFPQFLIFFAPCLMDGLSPPYNFKLHSWKNLGNWHNSCKSEYLKFFNCTLGFM